MRVIIVVAAILLSGADCLPGARLKASRSVVIGGRAFQASRTAVHATEATNATLTAVPGIKVGHHTLTGRPTGCTVVLVEAGVTAGVDVRGAAPATRDTDRRAVVHKLTEREPFRRA